jgi:hypothetical protein
MEKKGNVILQFGLIMLFAIIVFILALPPEVREALLNG